ncbi:AlbA family DNA-binding domain-containing protein [Bacillus mycoides]|uniref:AlbA family DNA-binding domain-containing protein n=1 Tax=Bacillus mycoides TaxID=1405 RepID=UPI001C03049C|nr:ATP-binding protein [Bacillus mycoides]
MYFEKRISEVTLEDLESLVKDQVFENQKLDYKRDLPANLTGDGKRELCKDIVAFANTEGGTLLYGINESKEGNPEIVGVKIDKIDSTLQSLNQIIKSNIEPVLHDYEFGYIHLQDNYYILGIDIPKSWARPHAVAVKKSTYRFYTRVNTDNIGLDIPGIQHLFLTNANLNESIKAFKANRDLQMLTGEGPLNMEGASISLHLIPQQAFTSQKQLDLNKINDKHVPPIYSVGYDPQFNLDGLIHFNANKTHMAYTQFFRNGILETASNGLTLPRFREGYIYGTKLIEELIKVIENYISFYKQVQIVPPVYVFISLFNVKGHVLTTDSSSGGNSIKKTVIHLPEFIIRDFNSNVTDLLRVPLDILWNAFGKSRCHDLEEFLQM